MLKFDQNLWKVSPCLDGGLPYYLLVNERSGNRIRLFEIEYQLLKSFDGTRSLIDVLASFRAKYNIVLGVEQGRAFTHRLLQRELLTGVDEVPTRDDALGVESGSAIALKKVGKLILPFLIGGFLSAAGLKLFETFTTYAVEVIPVREMSIPRFSPVRARSDIPMRSGRLSFASSGVVEELRVSAGDPVANGQIMAQLRLPTQVNDKLAELGARKRQYSEMASRLGAELGEARRFIERVRERIETLEASALQVPEAGHDNVALSQLSEEQELLLEKEQTLAELERRFEQVLTQLKVIEESRGALLAKHRDKVIRAPFDSVVQSVSCEMAQRVKSGEHCFSIVDQRNRIVEYRLRENPDLYVGARVQLLKGDRWISGTLDEITQVYQQYLIRIRYMDDVQLRASDNDESARLLERWIDDAAAIPRSALWDSTRSESVGYILVVRADNEAEVKVVKVVKRDARWVWVRIGDLELDESGLNVVYDLSEFPNTPPTVGKTFPISVTKYLDESFTRREWNPRED